MLNGSQNPRQIYYGCLVIMKVSVKRTRESYVHWMDFAVEVEMRLIAGGEGPHRDSYRLFIFYQD